MIKIVSISVNRREKEIPDVQAILTKYGEEIHSRIGYHNIEKDDNGLIIVIYTGEHIIDFCRELQEKQNVKVNYMEI